MFLATEYVYGDSVTSLIVIALFCVVLFRDVAFPIVNDTNVMNYLQPVAGKVWVKRKVKLSKYVSHSTKTGHFPRSVDCPVYLYQPLTSDKLKKGLISITFLRFEIFIFYEHFDQI